MNLLKNPNFDQGHHHQDSISEIVVPDGWKLRWIDKDTFPGCGNPPAYRPESVVWNIIHAPPHEKPIFFLAGNYCWKVFKAYAPVYFAASQVVEGLEAGVTYRFTANVYPDLVEGYKSGNKVRPGDMWHSESRAGWSAPNPPWPQHKEEGAITWSKWFNINNGNFKFGEYNKITMEFVAPGGSVEIFVECKSKWGSGENNWFMDAFTLERVDGKPDSKPVTPPVTPRPPQPIPEPEPEPEEPAGPTGSGRGKPREQYRRNYILLPEKIPMALALAAMRVALRVRATVGFSPDDAGVGDLDYRRVIAVDAAKIGTGLNQAWYTKNYPGVSFIAVSSESNPDKLEDKLLNLF